MALQEIRPSALVTQDAVLDGFSFEQVVAGPYEQLAARIVVELERPIFLPMGPGVPYSMSDLSRVMAMEDNQTVVVWMKRPGEFRRLAAYNTGTPYRSYPEELQLKVENVTPVDGGPSLPMPDETTWMHDTVAVVPSEQRKGIGKTLLNIMVADALKKGCTTWAVFLSLHESSGSKEMYDNHPYFRSLANYGAFVEGIVLHRGTQVTYRLYNFELTP